MECKVSGINYAKPYITATSHFAYKITEQNPAQLLESRNNLSNKKWGNEIIADISEARAEISNK